MVDICDNKSMLMGCLIIDGLKFDYHHDRIIQAIGGIKYVSTTEKKFLTADCCFVRKVVTVSVEFRSF